MEVKQKYLKTMENTQKGILLLFLLHCVETQVLWPDEGPKIGKSCSIPGVNQKGICKEVKDCPYGQEHYGSEIFTHCSVVPLKVIICCPESDGFSSTPIDVSPPNITEFQCGFPIYKFGPNNPYLLNNKALDLKDQGFEIVDVSLLNGAFISRLNYTDGEKFYVEHQSFVLPTGGKNARDAVTQYMALLGQQKNSKIDWLCSGILINEYWVLTAAHCMTNQRTINVVRLGEYDYKNASNKGQEVDFRIAQTVIYPEYKPPVAYHDLALLRLEKRVRFSQHMNPICLPWEDADREHQVGSLLSLTGWGATRPGGPGSSILLEVNVTVLENSQCEKGYSTLPFYSIIWPSGMENIGILCIGDELPEDDLANDACQGDSGGPVVDYDSLHDIYTLAGVVSKGHGCGSGANEYPGLYMDIRYPPYLSWIKRIVF